jgi:hypothetical protein
MAQERGNMPENQTDPAPRSYDLAVQMPHFDVFLDVFRGDRALLKAEFRSGLLAPYIDTDTSFHIRISRRRKMTGGSTTPGDGAAISAVQSPGKGS